MGFYAILCPRPSPAPEDSSCTVIQGYFSIVSRRFYPSEMYIMSQILLSYLRIDTISPSAPTKSRSSTFYKKQDESKEHGQQRNKAKAKNKLNWPTRLLTVSPYINNPYTCSFVLKCRTGERFCKSVCEHFFPRDPEQLNRSFLNLVDNLMKASIDVFDLRRV